MFRFVWIVVVVFVAVGCSDPDDPPVLGGDSDAGAVEDATEDTWSPPEDVGSGPGEDAGEDTGEDTGEDDPPLQCGALTECNGECVDLGSNDAHCGQCGLGCTGDHSCVAGECELECGPVQIECGGGCATCAFEGVHQVGCYGDACISLSCTEGYRLCDGVCSQCPNDGNSFGCDGAQCVISSCPTGENLCDGQCVDCPSTLGGTPGCEGGQCVVTCNPGYTKCDGECRTQNADRCGPQCEVCPGDPNGDATCSAGSCGLTCDEDYRLCGGGCQECPTAAGIETTQCIGGACEVATCQEGYQLCGDACCVEPPATSVVYDGFTVWTHGFVVDSLLRPHVLLEVGNNTSAVTVARYAGSSDSWPRRAVQTTAYLSGESMAIDSEDNLHITFSHYGGDYLRYYHWDGESWSDTDVDTEIGFGRALDIAVDTEDRPYIIYSSSDPDELKLAYKDDGEWSIETIEEGTAVAWLEVDSQDRPHILIRRNSGVRYGYRDGSEWILEDLAESVINYNASPFLVVDAQDNPHLSYYHRDNISDGYYDLRVATKEGGTWTFETVEADTYEVDHPHLGSTSVAVSSEGVVHVGWRNYVDGVSRAYYAVRDGSDWESTLLKTGLGTGRPVRVVVDRFGGAHVVHGTAVSMAAMSEYAYFP